MKDRIMLGLWKYMVSVPAFVIDKRKQLARRKKQFEEAMGFMSDDHRRVHHYAVRELPRSGRPLSPGKIAQELGLSTERVTSLLQDLEEHMTFLWRNRQGEVVWAYPVTVDPTPHRLFFSTGEQIFAA